MILQLYNFQIAHHVPHVSYQNLKLDHILIFKLHLSLNVSEERFFQRNIFLRNIILLKKGIITVYHIEDSYVTIGHIHMLLEENYA